MKKQKNETKNNSKPQQKHQSTSMSSSQWKIKNIEQQQQKKRMYLKNHFNLDREMREKHFS